MEKDLKEIFKNAIAESVKQVNFAEIEKEAKESEEMKKLDSQIDYLKTIDKLFNGRIKICGIK